MRYRLRMKWVMSTLLTIWAKLDIVDNHRIRRVQSYFEYESMRHWCQFALVISMRHWVPTYWWRWEQLFASNLSNKALGAKLVCWLDLCIRPSSSRVNKEINGKNKILDIEMANEWEMEYIVVKWVGTLVKMFIELWIWKLRWNVSS